MFWSRSREVGAWVEHSPSFGESLEFDEVVDLHAERVGDADEEAEPDADLAGFDFPEMSLVRARHQGKAALRQLLTLPFRAYGCAELFSAR